MQASVGWSPPKGVLGTLVSAAAERAQALRVREAELREAAAAAPRAPSFDAALRGKATVQLIAEIKRASPSRGPIRPDLDAVAQAEQYVQGGASAISVLTEPTRFSGDVGDLADVSKCGLAALRKDFIVDSLQLYEARAYGAAAILLIARALPPSKLTELHLEAKEVGLDTLVEVHTEDEYEDAVHAMYPIIGVNNRDLETLEIDTAIGARLMPWMPYGAVGVWESGIATRADVEQAGGLGADAVLVGSFLSASPDPVSATRGLTGVARQGRRAS